MQDPDFRKVLAEEYDRTGYCGVAKTIREGCQQPSILAILDAMRRVYLMGRDDANADADDAENESIQQMDDDATPSNPG